MSQTQEPQDKSSNQTSDPGVAKKKLIARSVKKQAMIQRLRDEDISVLASRVRMSRSPLLVDFPQPASDSDPTDPVIFYDLDPTDPVIAADADPTDAARPLPT